MLEELLTFDKLGSTEELSCILFDGIDYGTKESVSGLKKYCSAKIFSLGKSFDGIIKLLECIEFIKIEDDFYETTNNCKPTVWSRLDFFEDYFFYESLFEFLRKSNCLNNIFNGETTKFDVISNQYFMVSSQIPYKYYPIRNLLLMTGFLAYNSLISNHLFISSKFTSQFRSQIASGLEYRRPKNKRVISAQSLEISMLRKAELGKEAEIYVLGYENRRLANHPTSHNIKIISEDFVNAGYDIESYNNRDSIINDRFIEVKSFNSDVSFYWSKNEVEAAEDFGESYFLYLVDRSRIGDLDYIPTVIQNPYKKVFLNEFWKKEIQDWKIILEA